jgi:hypothetical protein
MSTTHDKQIERKIGNPAVGVDTSIVIGASVSSWIPVVVASTFRVVHVTQGVTCGSWRVNVFSNCPNVGASLTCVFIDEGTEDLAPRLAQGWRIKRSKERRTGNKSGMSLSGLWGKTLSRRLRALTSRFISVDEARTILGDTVGELMGDDIGVLGKWNKPAAISIAVSQLRSVPEGIAVVHVVLVHTRSQGHAGIVNRIAAYRSTQQAALHFEYLRVLHDVIATIHDFQHQPPTIISKSPFKNQQ